jgi:3-dehydrosphinganine reductase
LSAHYRDKLAWVFGGSQGIGLAIGEELVKQGCRVRLWARRTELLEKEAGRIGSDWTSLDVSDYTATETAIEAALKSDGTPQFVFNCAGLALPGYLLDLSAEDIATMNQVNYLGTAYVCKAVLPALVKQRGGHIINVSSLGGVMGLFGYTGYCGSKYAVMGFSEALRREVSGYGIRVSALCPPNTRTPGLDQENLRKPPEVLAQEEKVQVLEAAQVAKYLLKALPSNPFTVIPSFDGRLAHLLSRWAPGILNLFLKRPQAK